MGNKMLGAGVLWTSSIVWMLLACSGRKKCHERCPMSLEMHETFERGTCPNLPVLRFFEVINFPCKVMALGALQDRGPIAAFIVHPVQPELWPYTVQALVSHDVRIPHCW